MPEGVRAVVVGGGQAGLAVSHELGARGVEHVVLERGLVAQTWRDRWDSFCLVTPNEFIRLPGGEYAGPDPQGFLLRDELVAHFERYAASFEAPVHQGVSVSLLERDERGRFHLHTSEDEIETPAVVVASGAFQKPHRPAPTRDLPAWLPVIDAETYRNPEALPAGQILVVGSGQTGVQLAEELHDAGREVIVACGRAPWIPRRLDGRDAVSWLTETTFLEQSLEDLPNPVQARLGANVQTTGHGGGHDLNYRVMQNLGIRLAGHLTGADEAHAYFADDLAESVAFGDARYADVCGLIRAACAAKGIRVPEMPPPPPFEAGSPPTSLRLSELGAVIVTSGFRPDYATWVHIQGAFDELGFPIAPDGASAVAPGLYFVGVHFLRKRKSSLLYGVGEDAAVVAEQISVLLA